MDILILFIGLLVDVHYVLFLFFSNCEHAAVKFMDTFLCEHVFSVLSVYAEEWNGWIIC